MRNMLTGDNPARAGEDSYGKSEATMIPPKGTGPLLKQRLWLYFCSRVIWNDNDQMYMYRQSRISNHQKGHKKHRISTVRSVRYILFYDSRKLEFTVLPSFPSSAP